MEGTTAGSANRSAVEKVIGVATNLLNSIQTLEELEKVDVTLFQQYSRTLETQQTTLVEHIGQEAASVFTKAVKDALERRKPRRGLMGLMNAAKQPVSTVTKTSAPVGGNRTGSPTPKTPLEATKLIVDGYDALIRNKSLPSKDPRVVQAMCKHLELARTNPESVQSITLETLERELNDIEKSNYIALLDDAALLNDFKLKLNVASEFLVSGTGKTQETQESTAIQRALALIPELTGAQKDQSAVNREMTAKMNSLFAELGGTVNKPDTKETVQARIDAMKTLAQVASGCPEFVKTTVFRDSIATYIADIKAGKQIRFTLLFNIVESVLRGATKFKDSIAGEVISPEDGKELIKQTTLDQSLGAFVPARIKKSLNSLAASKKPEPGQPRTQPTKKDIQRKIDAIRTAVAPFEKNYLAVQEQPGKMDLVAATIKFAVSMPSAVKEGVSEKIIRKYITEIKKGTEMDPDLYTFVKQCAEQPEPIHAQFSEFALQAKAEHAKVPSAASARIPSLEVKQQHVSTPPQAAQSGALTHAGLQYATSPQAARTITHEDLQYATLDLVRKQKEELQTERGADVQTRRNVRPAEETIYATIYHKDTDPNINTPSDQEALATSRSSAPGASAADNKDLEDPFATLSGIRELKAAAALKAAEAARSAASGQSSAPGASAADNKDLEDLSGMRELKAAAALKAAEAARSAASGQSSAPGASAANNKDPENLFATIPEMRKLKAAGALKAAAAALERSTTHDGASRGAKETTPAAEQRRPPLPPRNARSGSPSGRGR